MFIFRLLAVCLLGSKVFWRKECFKEKVDFFDEKSTFKRKKSTLLEVWKIKFKKNVLKG